MPQPPQTLPIRLTNGVNTKDDEFVMQEMLNLENAVFDRPGSLRKRNGTTKSAGPAGVTTPVGDLIAYRDELLLACPTGLYSRTLSPSAGWTASKGKPAYWQTDAQTISGNVLYSEQLGRDQGAYLCDYIESSGIGVIAWLAGVRDGTFSYVCFTVFDLDTGAEFVSHYDTRVDSTSNVTRPRLTVNRNTGDIELWFAAQGSTTNYKYGISPSSPAAAPSFSSVVIAGANAGPISIDLNNSATVYAQAQDASLLSLRGVLNSGFSSGMGTLIATATNTIRQVAVAYDDSGNIWWAWSESNGTTTQIIRVVATSASNLSTVTGTAVTVATLASSSLPMSVEVIPDPGGANATVLWEIDGGGSDPRAVYYRRILRSGGALSLLGSGRQLLGAFMHIASRGRTINGAPHIWLTRDSDDAAAVVPFYSTTYLVALITADLSTEPARDVMAKALQREAGSKLADNTTSPNYRRTPSNFFYDSTRDRYRFAHARLVGVSEKTAVPVHAPCLITLSPRTTLPAALLTKSLVIGAALPQSYDGEVLVESGFLSPPDGLTLAQTSTGGALSDGKYSVVAAFEWTDSNGETQRSLPSNPQSITLTGGTATQKITCSFQALPLTRKLIMQGAFTTSLPIVVFYCTQAGGQTYYASASTAATSVGTSAFITALGTLVLYTDGGVVADDQPPPTNLLARAGDRLWAHGGDGELAFTKKRILTRSAEFSKSLTKQLSSFNDPTVLVELAGGRKCIMSDEQIAVFDGDGPGLDGVTPFNDDEIVERRIGCIGPHLRIDGGVLFKSKQGWYFISDGLDVQYVGAKVEAWNSYTVRGIAQDPASNRIKVILSDPAAPVLVFDGYTQTWAYERNSAAPTYAAITFWRDRQQLLDTSGFLWEQVPGLFTDNSLAIVTKGRTGWIAPAGLQGLWAVKRIAIVGQKKSDHKLVVVARYDNSEAIVETFTIDAGPAIAVGPYQWRMAPKKQQCKTLSLEFYDDFTGYTPGESFTLSEIALEMTVEAGLTRLPAAQTVKGV